MDIYEAKHVEAISVNLQLITQVYSGKDSLQTDMVELCECETMGQHQLTQ